MCVFTTLNCVFTGGIHLTIVHICFRSDSETDVGHNIYLPANRTMLIYTLFDTAVHTARDAGMKNNGSKTFELNSHYKYNSTSIEKKSTNGLTCKKVWKWFILRALHCKLIQNSLLKIEKATKSTRYNNLNKFNHFLCYFCCFLQSSTYCIHYHYTKCILVVQFPYKIYLQWKKI